MALVAIIAILIYGTFSGGKKKRSGSVADGKGIANDKRKGRGNVDALFWKRLGKLIKIVLPDWTCVEA